MRVFKYFIACCFLAGCSGESNHEVHRSNPRQEILGREFTDSEVRSIEIVEIEHPMLGGIILTKSLDKSQVVEFLSDFDNLEHKGIFKCGAKYVVRINFDTDTLRLKVCGDMVSNRTKDLYFELPAGESLIDKHLE